VKLLESIEKLRTYREIFMESKSVALLFPPLWQIESPYIAVPALTAFLRKHGFHVIQQDLNIEWYNEIVNSSYLRSLENKLSTMVAKKNIPTDQMVQIATASALLPFAYEHIDQAKKDDKAVIEPLAKVRAKRHIQGALRCISSIYYPTTVLLYEYKSKYDCTRLSNVLKGALTEPDNVFRSYFLNKIKKLFCENTIFLIGISITGETQLFPAFTLAHIVRQAAPKVPIVIGGGMLPYMRQALTHVSECFDFADYFVVGEGETAMLKLCKYLENREELCNVPNLIYKEKTTGKIKTTYTYAENVDSLSMEDYDGLDLGLYSSPHLLSIQGSRGCYWDRCAFCSLCGNVANKYRERDMKKIINGIESLLTKYHYRIITFSDECFSPSRLRKLVDILEERGLANRFIYFLLMRFENGLGTDLFKKAYATGLRWISWGLESAHHMTLRMMRKGITPEIAEKCLRYSLSADIWNNVFAMFDFPGAPDDDANITVDFALRNQEFIDTFCVNTFKLEGNSDIYKYPVKYNISIPNVDVDYIGPRYNFHEEPKKQFRAHLDKMPKVMEQMLKDMIFTTRLGQKWLAGLNIHNYGDYLSNNKLVFRSFIQAQVDTHFKKIALIKKSESLILWVPEYVQVNNCSNMPSAVPDHVMIYNSKTGARMLTNMGTSRIMQYAKQKIRYKMLVDQLSNHAHGMSKPRIEKKLREVCYRLIYYGYLEAE
jgi:radical SAM superfamily enzyme YgiQ (UPF0313 family)